MNIKINEINSELYGQELTFDGIITKIKDKEIKIDTALFECKSCLGFHEIKQEHFDTVYEPRTCEYCGGRSFKIIRDQSTYHDFQRLNIQDCDNFIDKNNRERDPKSIECIIVNDEVDQYLPQDKVKITGTVKLEKLKKLIVEVSKIKLVN